MKHYSLLYQDRPIPNRRHELPRSAGQGPSVAILLGLRNGAPFLGPQLESLARQTHRHWSLTISDDASSDNGAAIAERFARTMPGRDISILPGPNRGAARNFLGLLRDCDSQAGYAALCDQDDIWMPEKLTRAIDALTAISGDQPAVYCGRTLVVDASGAPRTLSPHFRRPPSFTNALVQSIAGGNTMVLNRPAIALMRIAARYDGSIPAHDWWIYQLVTGAGGCVIFDPEPQVLYRQHGTNLVGSNRGLSAKLQRLGRLTRGEFQRWTNANLTSLQALSPLLTPQNQKTLSVFRDLRAASLPHRLCAFPKSGIHRQTRTDTAALWLATALGRV